MDLCHQRILELRPTQIGVVCFTCDVCLMSGTVSGLIISWGLKKIA